jgi:secondary thiamine-phosphate synthase enzyme
MDLLFVLQTWAASYLLFGVTASERVGEYVRLAAINESRMEHRNDSVVPNWIKKSSNRNVRLCREAEMKSYTEYLVMETRKRREMVHITDEVEQVVRRSGVKDGLCFVSPMHITAAVYVNDLESGLIEDIGKWLEELAPARPDYKHHQTGEDNGDAHLKSLLLHHETTLPVTHGKLDLGTWQRVFYAEFDGQRRKRVIVKVLGVE